MYIKKSRLVVTAIVLIIVTFVVSIGLVNPFGISNLGGFLKFSYASRFIENSFYEDVDLSEAAEMAIAGVAASTGDPYTGYIWGDDAQRYMEEVEGNYCGVGLYIECDTDENLISVVSAIAGSPAEAKGISTGDKILSIDGQTYAGTDLNNAASYMRGQEGTDVVLSVRKAADNTVTDITLTRSKIEIESVSGKMLNGNIGYVSITQFTESVAEDLEKECENLSEQNMRALIIDLRSNPGGLLDEAIKAAGIFVPTGEVVTYTLDKKGRKREYKAQEPSNGKKVSVPIAILTNGGSASASEVLTGALKDYGIAKSVGEKSYGKGVVQSVAPIGTDGLLTVTVARYYTPNGVCIHGKGIEPDILSEMSAEKTARISMLDIAADDQLIAAMDYLNK